MAQDPTIPAADTAQGTATPDLSFEAAAETVETSLLEIWDSFLGHLPLLFAGFLTLLFVGLLARATRGLLRRAMRKTKLRRSLRELLARLLYLGLWGLGLLFAAMVVFPGLSPTKALGGLGLASVAIGFAFKDIFENFFAGLLILWRYPFDQGDFIQVGEITGKIEEITVRNSLIRRTTGELIVVPNSKLFTEPVDVLTNGESRRTEIVCGVAYDVDVERAIETIRTALETCETVSSEKDRFVIARGFGASSVDIDVIWWTGAKPIEVRRSRSEVVTSVKSALDEAGIEIPFPYRTLTFKGPGPALREGEDGSEREAGDEAAEEEAAA